MNLNWRPHCSPTVYLGLLLGLVGAVLLLRGDQVQGMTLITTATGLLEIRHAVGQQQGGPGGP